MNRKATWAAASAAVVAAVMACGGGNGGGGGGTPTAPSPTPGGGTGTTTTIVIGSDGRVSPSSLTVPPGTRVTFRNDHNRPHDMSSDPHPEHTDCPEINAVGFLQPGQFKQTGSLNTVRTCGFHDHNEPSTDELRGTIRIQ